jgi:hypothetical protein
MLLTMALMGTKVENRELLNLSMMSFSAITIMELLLLELIVETSLNCCKSLLASLYR